MTDVTTLTTTDDLLEKKKRKKIQTRLTRAALLSFPVYLLSSLLATILIFIGWAILQPTGFVPLLIDMEHTSTMMVGGEEMTLPYTIADPTNILLVSAVLGMLAYPLIWLLFPYTIRQHRYVGGYGISDLGQRMKSKGSGWLKGIGIGVLIGIGVGIVMVVLQALIGLVFHPDTSGETTSSMITDSIGNLTNGSGQYIPQTIALLLTACLIAPICEELLFRGLIGFSLRDSGLFRKMGDRARMITVCIVSGLIFGLGHFQPDASLGMSIMTMFLTGFIGAIFTYFAAYRFKSVVPTMAAHATYNTLAMVITITLGI